jgi:hypothetical protein
MLEANGGVEAMQTRIKVLFTTTKGMVLGELKGEAAPQVNAIFDYMADEELKAVPELMDDSARVYAEHLTETELRDMLAWSLSPSARSIRDKMPAMTQEILLDQKPLMQKMITASVHNAIDRVCAEKKCTPEQRQQITKLMSKVLPASS